MKKKIKITFLTGMGTETQAKIIDIFGMNNIFYDIQNNMIEPDMVLKIEVIKEPSYIEDLSTEA